MLNKYIVLYCIVILCFMLHSSRSHGLVCGFPALIQLLFRLNTLGINEFVESMCKCLTKDPVSQEFHLPINSSVWIKEYNC